MQIKDLNITELANLFNFTQNDDAKAVLHDLITVPLSNREEVIERQAILKGFLANIDTFTNYSYSRIDYREIYLFLNTFTDEAYLPKWLKYRLFVSRKKHYKYRSRCVQLILLYHRLHTRYIKNIDLAVFPEGYKKDIRFIDDYFNSFRLEYYERHIRANTFTIKHMVQIIKIISAKQKEQETVKFQNTFNLFEAYLSISLGINKHKFSFPEITDNNLSLQDFYHPLVTNAVRNSFTAPTNVILLTGPNMSGKSTLLKAIGICIYLGNIGFAIPAAKAGIPLFDNISIFINLNDDLQSGYSHFMTEVINLKNVATEAGSGTKGFSVFDELFRGTNNEDALEISRATLKGLLNFPQSLFFVSSHLHQLIEMEEVKSGKIAGYYLDCSLDNNTPKFNYLLKQGSSNIKIGRILFEKEGLNVLLSQPVKAIM
jgi:DNA mismatch repair protein MutS